MKAFGLLLFTIVFSLGGYAQKRMTAEEYIARYKHISMEEMKRTGIPASIKLAQGLLEAEMGNSPLVLRSNNHFGIKCKLDWQGESVSHDDDERGECFRKYDNPEDSYRDHSEFLMSRDRYASLFTLKSGDYKGWAYGLKKAGYATNPRYPQMLIYNIEKYNLHKFDEIVLSEKEETNERSKLVEDKQREINSFQYSDTVPVKRESQIGFADYKAKTRRNGLQAVFASRGTSLLAIATFHNIPLTRLLEYNDKTRDGLLEEDEWIYLERKNKESSQSNYISMEGETLYTVSQLFGVQLSRLVDYNNLTPGDRLKSGTRIYLRPVPINSLPSDSELKKTTIIHEVTAKEGLYSIAKKYNVSVQDIKMWNNLDSDTLRIGQQLIISKN